jgi:beta-galactosidase
MTGRRLTRRTVLKTTAAASVVLATPISASELPSPDPRRELLFDAGWKFSLGDHDGASQVAFDDREWRLVELPHDWSIEDRPGAPSKTGGWQPPVDLRNTRDRPKDAETFGPGLPIVIAQVPAEVDGGPPLRVGPFDAKASAGGWTTGWVVGGTGWYRKSFRIDDLRPSEQVELYFEGAYRETEVWINGNSVGRNINGYMGFAVDLTPHLRAKGPNVLAVKVSNEGDNSRWYSGSGIYRHVWLNRTGVVRIPLWGIAVETREIGREAAELAVSVEVENRSHAPADLRCKVSVREPGGRILASGEQAITIGAAAHTTLAIPVPVKRPALWSPEQPTLHTAEVTIESGGALVDRKSQRFGIRTLALSSDTGLRINFEQYKLKGACVHHDNGLLGAVALDAAERRKVRLLKDAGFNAIRCSHNPFSSVFLDACDEMGMIVVDEAFDVWERPKRVDDYHRFFLDHWREDLTNMIRRDRNHPSIVFWSIGNEINEINTTRGTELAGQLRACVRELDKTRFVTSALTMAHQGKSGAAARKQLDVAGYNYMYDAAVRDHANEPAKAFMNTESYAKDIHDIWQDVERYPWMLGDFAWTGMDYLGEVGLGSLRLQPLPRPKSRNMLDIFMWDYPAFQANSGDLDILGQKKPQGFYRDVVWGRSPLEVFVQRPVPDGTFEDVSNWGWSDEVPSWTWTGHEGELLTVRIYTRADEVSLQVNRREVERKKLVPGDRMATEIQATYQPGELTVVAWSGGKEIGRRRLDSVGPAHEINLWSEMHRGARRQDDLVYVFAEVRDASGRRLPDGDVPLSFSIEGPGRIIATGSANPFGIESFRDAYCRTFRGTALAIVRKAGLRGEVRVSALSEGLKGGRASV